MKKTPFIFINKIIDKARAENDETTHHLFRYIGAGRRLSRHIHGYFSALLASSSASLFCSRGMDRMLKLLIEPDNLLASA